jgi:hypothetical protein
MVGPLVDPSGEPQVLFADEVLPQDLEWRQ